MTETTQLELFTEPPPAPSVATGLFAEIVFDRPLDHAYTYAVPEELCAHIGIGKRVQAPFGRGDKPTIGYCVGLTEKGPERTVKPLLQVLDDAALLDEPLLRLTRWMADYYLCGWGQVLNAVVPAGVKSQAGTKATTFLEAVPEPELPTPLPKLSAKQQLALERLRAHGKPLELRKLARMAECGTRVLEALVEKGVAKRSQRRLERLENLDELPDKDAAPPAPITLNGAQQRAWELVEAALTKGGFAPFLLHGVTGSGKTELYLRALEKVVAAGKQVLVLVPEISLTPQTIQSFRSRCERVAVLHSHLSDAERAAHWRRICNGEVQVIVGARSAVFAPARNLGLIVIDEEHESSFKQDATPRYHGRDVAVMRARLQNLPIILGSATPALESWHNAQRGQYTLLELPNRVLNRPLPKVALIDLRHELPRGGGYQALSPALEHALKSALSKGGQAILLLNRRGFSTHVHCPSCGYVSMCKFCDLALTYHQQRAITLCHYCGYEEEPPQVCKQCGKAHIRYQGLGTEKLEAEIERKFPDYVARRMDSDTMSRPGSHTKLLNAFRRGEVHILFGTQMIAKGLDFPNVTLVGVINADIALHLPDFRAGERTFQLLAQVAGRAGRGPNGGIVLVQTFNTEHPAIALAARHDYAAFVQAEMAHRREHSYPPYQRMARIIVRSREQEKAAEVADRLGGAVETLLPTLRGTDGQPVQVRLLGPAEAPVFRLQGYFRYHLQMQSASSAALHHVLRAVLAALRPPSNVELTVDVDPLNMM